MMKTIRSTCFAVVIALAGVFVGSGHSDGAAFYAWRVADVPEWDKLNVRVSPSSQSQILVAYPNGTLLSMTGVCTNGVDLGQIAGLPAWQQRQYVRYLWCQTWVDPQGDGNYQPAWVYGKFIAPMQ